jgi:hypothetical protein
MGSIEAHYRALPCSCYGSVHTVSLAGDPANTCCPAAVHSSYTPQCSRTVTQPFPGLSVALLVYITQGGHDDYLCLLAVPTQVNELDSAVNRAAEQPQRFGLTPEEISSRRKWITATRRQVSSLC